MIHRQPSMPVCVRIVSGFEAAGLARKQRGDGNQVADVLERDCWSVVPGS